MTHRLLASRALLDLSHTVEHGMVTYKGLPAPIICDYLSREQSRQHYDPGTEFHIGQIEMVANTGTYLDSPFHRFAQGKDLSHSSAYSNSDFGMDTTSATWSSPRACSTRFDLAPTPFVTRA